MINLPKDKQGWSIVPITSNARTIFVSSSTGQDTNSGLDPSLIVQKGQQHSVFVEFLCGILITY
jgi:hypothetical protein